MKLLRTSFLALAGLVGVSTSAHAHFIWVHYVDRASGQAEVLFGDGIYQDSDRNLVRYIAGVDLWTEDGVRLDFETHRWGLTLDVPAETELVAGRCDMGVFSRPGSGRAVKLDYFVKGTSDLSAASTVVGTRAELVLSEQGGELVARVLFDGAPMPGAQVYVPLEHTDSTETLTTDEQGEVRMPRPRSGALSLRAKVTVDGSGEVEGQAYDGEHYYAMLTVANVRGDTIPAAADSAAWLQLETALGAVDAFPADVRGLAGRWRVQLGDDEFDGEFEVTGAMSEVSLEGASEAQLAWLRDELETWIRGRLSRSFGDGLGLYPVTFGDRSTHPLGRLVEVADPLETRFRLSDHECKAKEWTDGESRVSEVVLARQKTDEGRYLPTHTQRSFSASKSGELQRTETRIDTFQRAEGLELPASRQLLRTARGGVHVAQLSLRNIEVLRSTPEEGVAVESHAVRGTR